MMYPQVGILPNTSGPPPQALITRAVKDSVQSQPPEVGAAPLAFFASVQRGPLLPSYGSRERDRWLRHYDRHDWNTVWRGARAGVINKIVSAPTKILGDKATVAYYQDICQYAQFGAGWSRLWGMVLRDFLSLDNGGWVEIIGPGMPDEPIQGRVTGLAHLDSLRVWPTGNAEYPALYYSPITGKLHKMHRTRIWRMVDAPDGDELLYGHGESALSRAIAISQREMLMGRYIEAQLDDKPAPGIVAVSGTTKTNMDAAEAHFLQRKQADDGGDVFGKTLFLFSLDPANPIQVQPTTFSTPPEKFSFTEYTQLDVNALALALGVDKQELWELTSGTLGSGTQSVILAQKSRGKTIGVILSSITRFMNIHVLPEPAEFKFEFPDAEQDAATAQLDQQYLTMAKELKDLGASQRQVFQLLVNRSATFREVLTDDSGAVAVDTDQGLVPDAVPSALPAQIASPQTPPASNSNQTIATDSGAAPSKLQIRKDYGTTRTEFVQTLTDLIRGGTNDELSRRRFGIVERGLLRRYGEQIFQDGKLAGGVDAPLDEDELAQLQAWIADQSPFVTQFADEVYGRGLSDNDVETRAELWANKSLQPMYDAGLYSANRNGMYKWMLGQTEEHCPDCLRLNGQVHRLKEWYSRNWLPKSDRLTCGGWLCDCSLLRTGEPATGRF